ncbi:MAG: hypothetical protein HRT88_06630, partial [Lentisphaeraceae bacterium]|nr:hypothetical protein [Lentisphaeraceae bacterium]
MSTDRRSILKRGFRFGGLLREAIEEYIDEEQPSLEADSDAIHERALLS